MTRKVFDTTIALTLLDSKEEFPVDFDRAWRWLGFSRKDNAKQSLIDCGFIEGIDFLINQELEAPTVTGWVNPKPKEKISLTIDCFKTWGMMANTEQGKEVRRYFLECEKKVKAQATLLINQQSDALDVSRPALPPVLPEISKRNLARKLVDQESSRTSFRQDILWRQAYAELDYLFGYNIGKKKCKGSKLERIEADGHLDNLIAIMQKLWTTQPVLPGS
jgi:phage anti-repressor protein